MTIFKLNADPTLFPDPEYAEPSGLVALGGDLSVTRLLHGYAQGIFPWYNENEPILWWNPDPRLVLFSNDFHVSKRLRRTIRHQPYRITTNQACKEVIHHCRTGNNNRATTWITQDIMNGYEALHNLGYVQSVECWQDKKLVAGLYGVGIGTIFFGESMFTLLNNGSKVAFYYLVQALKDEVELIDCQIGSTHLQSLGARNLTKHQFKEILKTAIITLSPLKKMNSVLLS